MDLWTPSGNVELDQIDLAIESALFSVRRVEASLEHYEDHLGQLLVRMQQLRNQMMVLKEAGLAVSLSEYAILLHNYDQLAKTRNQYYNKIQDLKKEIEEWDTKIEKYNKDRAKLEPKVLEFKRK